jgi:hypothetical protein
MTVCDVECVNLFDSRYAMADLLHAALPYCRTVAEKAARDSLDRLVSRKEDWPLFDSTWRVVCRRKRSYRLPSLWNVPRIFGRRVPPAYRTVVSPQGKWCSRFEMNFALR